MRPCRKKTNKKKDMAISHPTKFHSTKHVFSCLFLLVTLDYDSYYSHYFAVNSCLRGMLGNRAQAVESADEHVRLMQLIVLVLSKMGAGD